MHQSSALEIVFRHNSYLWQTFPLGVLKVISVEIYFCLVRDVRAEEIPWSQQSKILLIIETNNIYHAFKNEDRFGELLAHFYDVVFTQINFGCYCAEESVGKCMVQFASRLPE